MTEDEARKAGRAFALGILDALRAGAETPKVTSPTSDRSPRWMKVSEYAKTRGFSRSTVQAWIADGMPATAMGRGYRVDVAAADAWLEHGGARRARHDA